MYHPTTRVLTVLELLQSRQRITGPELAERLEVNIRTARRYITMLQDLGIPVEAERGRYGAYRLRPGFKLPPLMFTDEEALALTLGLLAARQLRLSDAAPAVEGALAKIERVLPITLRERVHALQDILVLDVAPAGVPASSGLVALFSEAARQQRRVRVRYSSMRSSETERAVDPYGMVYRLGRWYMVGYCHLREDLRVFRLDRVLQAELCAERFTRPADFDTLGYVLHSLATMPGTWDVRVLIDAPLEQAQQRVPAWLATLEQTSEGVEMRCYSDDLPWIARFLAGIGLPLKIQTPTELRGILRQLAEDIAAMAAG